MMQRLFGRAKTPEEQFKAWKQSIREQSRQIDRQIRSIEAQEKKVQQELKVASKRPNSQAAMKTLALELVRSRHAKDRMLTAKTQLNSVVMQLQQQMAMVKVSGAIQKSTVVMTHMNALMRLPDIAKAMSAMSQEMMKAGLIEEMMDESLSSALDEGDVEMDAQVEEEVSKVMEQAMAGTLSMASSVPVSKPGASNRLSASPVQAEEEDEEEDAAELANMKARLASLK